MIPKLHLKIVERFREIFGHKGEAKLYFAPGKVTVIGELIDYSGGKDVNNIGNLIILEGNLNVEADNKNYLEKIPVYKKSNYVWVKEFTSKHSSWTNDMIKDRAKEMAALYYNKFIQDYLR